MPLPNMPRFMTGQMVSVALVTGITVAADGTATAGADFDMKALGVFRLTRYESSKNLVEISATDAMVENHQPTKIGFDVTLEALDKAGKVQGLIDLYAAYDYIRFEMASGSTPGGATGSNKRLVGLAAIDRLSTGYDAAPNTTTIQGKACGVLPQWSASPTI